MTVIYLLLVAHFVADFLCQSDWMAINKSKSWRALALHVGAYMMALWWVGAGGMVLAGHGAEVIPDLWIWLIVNAAAHFVQDAITSRINARLWFVETYPRPLVQFEQYGAYPLFARFNDKRHWFFVGIGADQLLHYVTLFVTAGWWLQ